MQVADYTASTRLRAPAQCLPPALRAQKSAGTRLRAPAQCLPPALCAQKSAGVGTGAFGFRGF